MTHHSLFAGFVFASALALQPAAASAQNTPVPVPSNLAVPEGHVAFLETKAFGTQNYICMPAAEGVAWKFLGPQATVFVPAPKFQQQIATHFLSANPDEQGTHRATWQASSDSSLVWAKMIQPSTDPNYVAPGAIPWLLLEAVGRADGPIGSGLMTRTTYIHRVNTAGGVAPATGCTQLSQAGAVALVPYTTDYIFYRAGGQQ
jgi:hypothetical protein